MVKMTNNYLQNATQRPKTLRIEQHEPLCKTLLELITNILLDITRRAAVMLSKER